MSLFVFASSFQLFAQSSKELEEKKKQLQNDIIYTNKLLAETENNKKSSLTQLSLLNKKISTREELINMIAREIKQLEKQIEESALQIEGMQRDLHKLKDEYAKMIYYAYKNQSGYARLMFVFSSKDFNQAYQRLKYMQQYTEFRKKQAAEIVSRSQALIDKMKALESKKKSKLLLLTNREEEKLSLTSEKQEKEVLLGSIHDKEKQLIEDLKKKQKESEKLQKAIEDIIRKEIEKKEKERLERERIAREKAKETKVEPKIEKVSVTSGFALTPEEELISSNFSGNKGKLPWPAQNGIITGTFGEHAHPELKYVKTINNGIDISTQKETKARAIFEGTVTGVVVIPGANKAVIVRHGEYLSVYSNLRDVFVKHGDKVTTKQDIGIVYNDDDDGKTVLHLEIWKGKTKLDPATWISKN